MRLRSAQAGKSLSLMGVPDGRRVPDKRPASSEKARVGFAVDRVHKGFLI